MNLNFPKSHAQFIQNLHLTDEQKRQLVKTEINMVLHGMNNIVELLGKLDNDNTLSDIINKGVEAGVFEEGLSENLEHSVLAVLQALTASLVSEIADKREDLVEGILPLIDQGVAVDNHVH